MPTLAWDANADLTPDRGGYGGTVSVLVGSPGSNKYQDLIIAADGAPALRSAMRTVLFASDLNGLNAPNLYIGGAPRIIGMSISAIDPFSQANLSNSTVLQSGAVLTGGQVVLTGNNVRLDPGATIDTRGYADVPVLDSSIGYAYGSGRPSVIASNGRLSLDSSNVSNGTGTISIGTGAGIYSRQSIGLIAPRGVSFEGAPLLGAKDLELVAAAINLGTAADLAAARGAGKLPAGFDLTQEMFAALVAGNPSRNITGVRNLGLYTNSSVNVYGAVNLDLSALDRLTLNTASIYGAGTSSDNAVLKVGSVSYTHLTLPTTTLCRSRWSPYH